MVSAGHKYAPAKLRHGRNQIAENFLPQVKAFIGLWAPTLSWLGVEYHVHPDRVDVIFRPKLAEYLIREQLELLSNQRRMLLEMLPGCRVKWGRIGGVDKLEDDCWMIWPKAK